MKLQVIRSRLVQLHKAHDTLMADSYLKDASFTSEIREEIEKWEHDLKQIEKFRHELATGKKL